MVILSEEYEDFLVRMNKYFRSVGYTDGDMLLKAMEEAGEVAEAWVMFRGLKPRKGTAGASDVAKELADLAMCAMLCIIQMGFQPSAMLEGQWDKMRERFPI